LQERNKEIKLAAPAKTINNRDIPAIFMIPAQRIFGSGKSPVGRKSAIRI
jgi:hypothetical protein